jgi:ABC-type nitrate/sulfonate/bicarbonate transport system substrate-binding protein
MRLLKLCTDHDLPDLPHDYDPTTRLRPDSTRPLETTVKKRIALVAAMSGIVLLTGCGSDAQPTPETTPDTTTNSADSAARCAANKAVGKLTYASSFDFAAAASIIDVVVAKEKGYFEALCLDVELKPGFSTGNYPLVAAGQVQFSSAGSYTELVNYSKDGAKFSVFIAYGKTPIEALVVKDPAMKSLADLKGKTIGMKGDIPPSIVAMLSAAGLKRGTDYKEVLLDGFDPKVHLAQPIDAVPVYKSNEPGQLDAGGVKYGLFDPTAESIPGSFGILYTSADFAAKNPTVVEDFARAALKGMEDAVADPAAAVAISVKQINAAGNQAFLTAEGETFRWTAELAEVVKGLGGQPIGAVIPAVFDAETAAYTAAGILTVPDPKSYDPAIVAKLYGADGKVAFTPYAP